MNKELIQYWRKRGGWVTAKVIKRGRVWVTVQDIVPRKRQGKELQKEVKLSETREIA